jgi:hypothetical protein
MRRVHLFEVEDQPWCPEFLRAAITDFLRALMEWFAPYAAAAPLLARALAQVGETEVVDLCSGSGGPWRDLLRRISSAGGPAVQVRLSDLYPNHVAYARLGRLSGGCITGEPESVDATAVPARLTGFRTLFTALHHFPPDTARAILADAVGQRRGIAVFEITRRSPLGLLGMLFLPVLALLLTPFIRPIRWDRLFWTYLVPVVPLVVWFEGSVSCLRTYTPAELRQLVAGFGEYRWEVGTVRGPPLLTLVTYLIGTPASGGVAVPRCAGDVPTPRLP